MCRLSTGRRRQAGPYKPRLSLNLAVALAFGLMLGGAAAFGREIFDSSYRSPEDLEEGLGLPLLGIIPRSDETADLDKILNDHRSAVTEAYRSLRTALQFSTADGTPRTLVVTSAMPSEGKSTASVNLAAQFAKLGLRVLLIDADLRKPSLHRLLGCDHSRGLSQFLVAGSTPPDAFQATALPNLTLCRPGRCRPTRPSSWRAQGWRPFLALQPRSSISSSSIHLRLLDWPMHLCWPA
jgi:polysaccharide biosynthesis transport protein